LDDGVPPLSRVKARPAPTPVDQPGLVEVLKSNVTVGAAGGSGGGGGDGGVEGGAGGGSGPCGGAGGDGGQGMPQLAGQLARIVL
jgi:hypothetical protein